MPGQNTSILTDALQVKINGSALTTQQQKKVKSVTVESSMHIPDMVILVLDEIDQDMLDGDLFKVGNPIEVGLAAEDTPTATPIFKGEITGLEPSFENNLIGLHVRGYDKSHRLHRGTKTKAWVQVKDSDLASQIASSNGLTADVEATTEVFDHVFQYAQSDFDFLTERAERIGYQVSAGNGHLKFAKPKSPDSADVTLEWGKELAAFHPRLTLSEQVNEVTVRGWDVMQKEAIVGQASSSDVEPAIGLGNWGGAAAQSALSGSATRYSVRQWVQSQSDAQTIAQGLLNDVNGGFIEAEGQATGTPTLHAGMVVEIKGIGAKFSGKYRVTTIRHEYKEGDYETFFTVEGSRPDLLSYLVESRKTKDMPWNGVVTALVTNNDSSSGSSNPGDHGYVKLKYPWLDESQESYWARLAVPGGGAQRGIYFLPEVNDEVLVAFEQGDFNRPYVIGGLYNGKDAPPGAVGTVVNSGQVIQRFIKTRTGHTITLSDKSGEEYIEIKDSQGNTQIKFDTTNKKITMDSQGEVTFTSTGKMSFTSQNDIEITTQSGNVKIQGQTFSAKGMSSAEMKSDGGSATVQGLTATFEGTTQAELKGAMTQVNGNAMVQIQGAMVMIN